MISVAQNHLRLQRIKLCRADGFDRGAGADRHENRRFDDTMRGRQSAAARRGIRVSLEELEHGRVYYPAS